MIRIASKNWIWVSEGFSGIPSQLPSAPHLTHTFPFVAVLVCCCCRFIYIYFFFFLSTINQTINLSFDSNQPISIRWKSIRAASPARRRQRRRPRPPGPTTPARPRAEPRWPTTQPGTEPPPLRQPRPATRELSSTRSVRFIPTKRPPPKNAATRTRNIKWRKHRLNVSFRPTPVIHSCLFCF